jgi:MFS family permease
MLAAIAVAQLTIVLEMNVMPIALPSLRVELGIAGPDRHWVITAYTLAFGGTYLLALRVAGLLGRRRTFLAGMAGFTVASVVAGMAGEASVLFAARAVQGAFGAFLLAPANLAFVGGAFAEPRVRARAIGVFTAVAGGGGVAGVVLAGALTEYLSWRWCLFVVVPLAVFAVAVAWYAFGADAPGAGVRHYDLRGAALLTLGLTALVFGISAVEVTDGAVALAVLAAAAVLLVGFAVAERRSRAPLLSPHVVAERSRAGVYLAVLAANIGTFGTYLLLSFLMQEELGYRPLQAGLAFLPLSVCVMAGTAVATRLVSRVRPRSLLGGGLALVGAGVGWLVLLGPVATPDVGYAAHVLPSVLLLGLGVSWIMVPANATIMQGLAPKDAGAATPLVNASTQIGGVIGAPLLTVLAGVFAGPGAQGTAVAGAIGGGLIVVVALCVFFLVDRGPLAGPPTARPSNPAPSDIPIPDHRSTEELAHGRHADP